MLLIFSIANCIPSEFLSNSFQCKRTITILFSSETLSVLHQSEYFLSWNEAHRFKLLPVYRLFTSDITDLPVM